MRVHGVGAVAIGGGARSAADRFVVAERRVAEEQVVHRPLAGRRDPQRAEQHVDDALRGLDVAAHHGRALLGELLRGGFSRHVGQDDPTGASTPWLSGMSSSIRNRRQYITAAVTIARLAFRLPGSTPPVPVKSIVAESPAMVSVTAIGRAVVEMIDELAPAVGQFRQRAAHLPFGGRLDVPHVGLDDRQRVALDEPLARSARRRCWLAATCAAGSSARIVVAPRRFGIGCRPVRVAAVPHSFVRAAMRARRRPA